MGGRLLPLLQVLGGSAEELAFLQLYLWFVPERSQVILHQGVQLEEEYD